MLGGRVLGCTSTGLFRLEMSPSTPQAQLDTAKPPVLLGFVERKLQFEQGGFCSENGQLWHQLLTKDRLIEL